MNTLKYVAFVCPHCGRNLSRHIHSEVLRAHVEYECEQKQGGCGKGFEALYRRDEGLITKPPQPLHSRHLIA